MDPAPPLAPSPSFRVPVAGSWSFADYPRLAAALDRLLADRPPGVVVSGGAGGADRLGERYARDRGWAVDRHEPDWGRHGRAAGPVRNRDMVAGCDLDVFFWDGASPGTAGAIGHATAAGVPVEVVRYADRPPAGVGRVPPPEAGPPSPPPPAQPPKLLDRLRHACRVRHYSIRTEDAYHDWAERFIRFHGVRHPLDMAEPEADAFLAHLAVDRHVAAGTQNQALAAVLFLYAAVLGRPLDKLAVVRAKRPDCLPVILSRAEVRAVLGRLDGVPRVVGLLLYGSGLRVLEAVRLRVHDLDFGAGVVVVRDGRGGKDRRTVLPDCGRACPPLEPQAARM